MWSVAWRQPIVECLHEWSEAGQALRYQGEVHHSFGVDIEDGDVVCGTVVRRRYQPEEAEDDERDQTGSG
jgi:hypothetical protein